MTEKSFFSSLLDFSFEQSLTIKMVKILYVFAMIGSVITGLLVLISGVVNGGFFSMIFGLIGGILSSIIILVASRLGLELIIVIFRIADHTGEIARIKATESRAPNPAPSVGSTARVAI